MFNFFMSLLISTSMIIFMISCKKIDAKIIDEQVTDNISKYNVSKVKVDKVLAEQKGVYSLELLKAVHALDRDKMDKLIMSGVDVNGRFKGGHQGNTILMTLIQNNYSPYTSKDNNKEAITMLLNSGAIIDLNYQNDFGYTALAESVRGNNKSIAKQLLKLGADVNLPSNGNNTLLMSAIRETKDYELVELLIKAGVDLNVVNEKGYTALGYAIEVKDQDRKSSTFSNKVVKLLIDSGADINISTIEGSTAMNFALEHATGAYKIIDNKPFKLLIESGGAIDGMNAGGNTYLTSAVYANNAEMVVYLIEQGADINTTNDEGVDILTIAKENGFVEIVELIENAKIKK